MVLPDVLLKKHIDDFFSQKKLNAGEYVVEVARELKHGDLTTNAAMVSYPVLKDEYKNPRVLADDLLKYFSTKTEASNLFQKIEVAGPGFINFWYHDDFLKERLASIVSSKTIVGITPVQKVQKELIENTQPNTNKPLHIGHLRNTALGEALVGLRKAIGHNAFSGNINNDRGIHIVKAMWGYLQYGHVGEPSNDVHDWKKLLNDWKKDEASWKSPKSEEKKADHFVGEYYVLGDKAEKQYEDVVLKQFAQMLQAWEDEEKNVRTLWKVMNGWFYEGFRETHGRFIGVGGDGKQFAQEWYESDVYADGKDIVLQELKQNGGKGLFYKREKDGTVMARLEEKYKLPDKVVVRSDGTSVYITQDIALAKQRVEEDHIDFSAYVVGSEQELHFQQLFAICEALGIGTRDNYMHVSYGMVNLTGGAKMSSREGTVILADELMDVVKTKLSETFEMSDEEKLERVMLGSIKYWMLRYNPHMPISFDVEKSVSISGNSGPYVQYAYARTQSIVKKSSYADTKSFAKVDFSTLEEGDKELLRFLTVFPFVVSTAAESFSPNLVCNYVYELASVFNTYYQKHKVVGSAQEEFRVSLTRAVGTVLSQGLELLGIETVEGM